jgi:hypothetical protein
MTGGKAQGVALSSNSRTTKKKKKGKKNYSDKSNIPIY